MFIYPIYNHNWRFTSTVYTYIHIYIYNKTNIKRNILTIKQNTSGSRSGLGLISTPVGTQTPAWLIRLILSLWTNARGVQYPRIMIYPASSLSLSCAAHVIYPVNNGWSSRLSKLRNPSAHSCVLNTPFCDTWKVRCCTMEFLNKGATCNESPASTRTFQFDLTTHTPHYIHSTFRKLRWKQ